MRSRSRSSSSPTYGLRVVLHRELISSTRIGCRRRSRPSRRESRTSYSSGAPMSSWRVVRRGLSAGCCVAPSSCSVRRPRSPRAHACSVRETCASCPTAFTSRRTSRRRRSRLTSCTPAGSRRRRGSTSCSRRPRGSRAFSSATVRCDPAFRTRSGSCGPESWLRSTSAPPWSPARRIGRDTASLRARRWPTGALSWRRRSAVSRTP